MAKLNPQRGVVAPVPEYATFLGLMLKPGTDAQRAVETLAALKADSLVLLGVGPALLAGAGNIPGARAFPGNLPHFPSAQRDAWFRLGHKDASKRRDVMAELLHSLRDSFDITEHVDAFLYKKGRDLSGFKDGTENPKGKAAVEAALIRGVGAGVDGGSFVMAQRWVHDMEALRSMAAHAKDAVIGRKMTSDKEIPDAPVSAHVKRTAQESFSPPSFMVRRSMPYSNGAEEGLYFVAFVANLDVPERMMHRMSGRDDGVVDGLFTYSRAVSGGYYFCPPVRAGKYDLRAALPSEPVASDA